MHYKLIDGQNIIGVISEDDFRRIQKKHHLIVYSDINNAQFVEYKDNYYRDNWLKPLDATDVNLVNYSLISIVRIEEDEYNILSETLETQEQIGIEGTEDIEEPQEEETLPVDVR